MGIIPLENKRSVGVSKDRVVSTSVWPPRGPHNAYAVTLEDNRQQDGKWSKERMYLPTGVNLLLLSEHTKQAWEYLEALRRGQEEPAGQ